jgi:hypothetical protein
MLNVNTLSVLPSAEVADSDKRSSLLQRLHIKLLTRKAKSYILLKYETSRFFTTNNKILMVFTKFLKRLFLLYKGLILYNIVLILSQFKSNISRYVILNVR